MVNGAKVTVTIHLPKELTFEERVAATRKVLTKVQEILKGMGGMHVGDHALLDLAVDLKATCVDPILVAAMLEITKETGNETNNG